MIRLAAAIFLSLPVAVATSTAWAGDLVAIVEAAPPGRDDVVEMDMVEAGRVIALAAGESMVVSYLESCLQETINGGKVTISMLQSNVAGGTV